MNVAVTSAGEASPAPPHAEEAPRRGDGTLVIHPGALGDVLQAVPALRAMRARWPAARVTFAGQPRLGRLLLGTGIVDEATPFDSLGLEALFAPEAPLGPVRGRLARFARAVSWFGSRAAPFPERLRAVIGQVLLARPVPEAPGRPVWQHLLETLAPWGVPEPSCAPLTPRAAWRAEAQAAVAAALGEEPDRPLLVIHPGAGGAWKRWPPEHFAATVRALLRDTGCRVLLHQGPADADAADNVERALGAPLPRLVRPDLHVLAGALASAQGYLGSDAGVSHLAASVGAPAVIVFPAATAATWQPWSATATPVIGGDERDDIGEVARRLGSHLGRRPPVRAST